MDTWKLSASVHTGNENCPPAGISHIYGSCFKNNDVAVPTV